MFDWVQVRALAGPIKGIHRVVPPVLSWLCASGQCPVGRWTFSPVGGAFARHDTLNWGQFNLGFIRPENLVSHTPSGLQSGHSAINPRLVVSQWWETSRRTTISTQDFWKALSPPPIASAKKSRGRSKLLPFKNNGGHCALGTFNAAECFCSLPQICTSTQYCLQALQAVPLTSGLGFSIVSCDTLYSQVCASPNHVQSI